jgi:hypothetical protein
MNIEYFLNKRIPEKTFLVVCGNVKEFEVFCQNRNWEYDNGNTEFEGCEFVYCRDENSLRGQLFDDVIHYGSWHRRIDVPFTAVIPYIKNNKYSSWKDMMNSEYFKRYA